MSSTKSPTVEFYASLQHAFDHFNDNLFEGKLPPCLLTLRSSSRHFGYHHRDRFVNSEGEKLDELGLHPGFFTLRPAEEVLSTLVHEMVHHWQDCVGQPSKSNPHNREWAMKMREIGLEPSSTGLPGGKDTGQHVSHYIRPNGLFIKVCRELVLGGFRLQWFDRHVPRAPVNFQDRQEGLEKAGMAVEISAPPIYALADLAAGSTLVVQPPPVKTVDRIRYLCSVCGIRAWAANEVLLLCGACAVPMVDAK